MNRPVYISWIPGILLLTAVLCSGGQAAAQSSRPQVFEEGAWQRPDTAGKRGAAFVLDGMSPQQKRSRVMTLYYSGLARDWQAAGRRSSVQLAADTLTQAGRLWADFDFSQGGLHPVQQAYNRKQVTVGTWGIKELGRVRLAGRFSFSRVWEDSLAAHLTGPADGLTPYYYFTPKAGTYERQIYSMGMSFAYDVIKDRLFIGTDIDYLHRISSGSVDPRARDAFMEVDFRPSLSYKKGHTLIGLSLIKGYGNEDMGISYKSDLFGKGNAFPRRNFYLNMGYGSLILKTLMVKDNRLDHQGMALDFSTRWKGHTLRGALAYQKQYMDSYREPDTLLITDKLARWSLNKYSSWLQFRADRPQASALWQLNWQREKGHDSNIIFGGRNYFASGNMFAVSYLHLAKMAPLQWEWGAHAAYREAERTDVLAGHHLRWEQLEAALTGGLYFPGRDADLWKLEFTPRLLWPLSLSATLPANQENSFSENIFYPELAYRRQVLLDGTLVIGYDSADLIPGLYSGLSLSGGWTQRLSDKSFDGVQVPGTARSAADSRLRLRLAFHVYL